MTAPYRPLIVPCWTAVGQRPPTTPPSSLLWNHGPPPPPTPDAAPSPHPWPGDGPGSRRRHGPGAFRGALQWPSLPPLPRLGVGKEGGVPGDGGLSAQLPGDSASRSGEGRMEPEDSWRDPEVGGLDPSGEGGPELRICRTSATTRHGSGSGRSGLPGRGIRRERGVFEEGKRGARIRWERGGERNRGVGREPDGTSHADRGVGGRHRPEVAGGAVPGPSSGAVTPDLSSRIHGDDRLTLAGTGNWAPPPAGRHGGGLHYRYASGEHPPGWGCRTVRTVTLYEARVEPPGEIRFDLLGGLALVRQLAQGGLGAGTPTDRPRPFRPGAGRAGRIAADAPGAFPEAHPGGDRLTSRWTTPSTSFRLVAFPGDRGLRGEAQVGRASSLFPRHPGKWLLEGLRCDCPRGRPFQGWGKLPPGGPGSQMAGCGRDGEEPPIRDGDRPPADSRPWGRGWRRGDRWGGATTFTR